MCLFIYSSNCKNASKYFVDEMCCVYEWIGVDLMHTSFWHEINVGWNFQIGNRFYLIENQKNTLTDKVRTGAWRSTQWATKDGLANSYFLSSVRSWYVRYQTCFKKQWNLWPLYQNCSEIMHLLPTAYVVRREGYALTLVCPSVYPHLGGGEYPG